MKNPASFHGPLTIPFIFSSVVMALCVYKLIAGVPDNERALYWGGVSSVMAYWLPSPIRQKELEFPSKEADNKSHTGLQVVQHPASNVDVSHPPNNGILRYQNGEKHSW